MNSNILEVQDLNYKYGDGTHALKGLNLTIQHGKTTAVLGSNGAGKSTLFLSLNGILKPTSGQVIFKGLPLDYSRKGLKDLRKSIGIVFQDPDNQLFSASVFKDISFGPVNIKLPHDEVQKRVETAMERTGISHLKDKPTHFLSFGQKKRVAIAGVLAMEPEVLVLDEPTAGLDPMGVSEIMKLIREIQKDLGLSVVISTHDIDIVPLYCDYSYVIDKGRIVLRGTPKEVFCHRDELRSVNLRLPRIGHLMEILKEKDHFIFNNTANTISEARKEILDWKKNRCEKRKDYMVKSGKELQLGYTTGSCATAAAKAGAIMLLTKQEVKNVKLILPGGGGLDLNIHDIKMDNDTVTCCVVKDAGDDPDITDGIKVYAKVRKNKKDINIDGGIGVGMVTVVGLPCKTGEPAINPGPRKMILGALLDVKEIYCYEGGFDVEIFVPQGEEIAKKTFNERLGIIGGISILGTTGIVEPMSESSLVETIKLEMEIKKQKGQTVLFIAPGNYGIEFAKSSLALDIDNAVKCSNYMGETLDYGLYLGFEKLLLIGHIGKLVKIAAGVMNTHSKIADCRNEIFAAHSALAGADSKTVEKIMNAKTTNEIHDILIACDISNMVYESILKKIIYHLNYRVMNKMQIEVVVFSNENGVLMKTDNANNLINALRHD